MDSATSIISYRKQNKTNQTQKYNPAAETYNYLLCQVESYVLKTKRLNIFQ